MRRDVPAYSSNLLDVASPKVASAVQPDLWRGRVLVARILKQIPRLVRAAGLVARHGWRGKGALMPTTSFMGGTVRRREDPRLITGSATYVDDIELPGMLHLAVLRSPFAHARILSIDSSAAKELPGVVAVVRGEEVQDLIPPAESEAKGEGESGPPPRIPLAVEVTNYVGDPVVAVVATEAAIAEDALELVREIGQEDFGLGGLMYG